MTTPVSQNVTYFTVNRKGSPSITFFSSTPTSTQWQGFKILDEAYVPSTKQWYKLLSLDGNQADWQLQSSSASEFIDSIVTDSGTVIPVANIVNLVGGTSVQVTGSGNTATINVTVVGVAHGGTGLTSTTAYGVLAGGTTSTGNLQNIGTGTSGQVLVSNGTSALPSFQTFTVNRQVFTNSGTYTPTSGMQWCDVEVIGGGGGSGGCATTGAGEGAASAGGGGGGYARKVFSDATIGASQTVTVGAAGTAGAAGGNDGGNGGISSVGALISATGGLGGLAGINTTTVYICTAGTGGTGSLGDFNTTGSPGGIGFALVTGTAITVFSGYGGCTFFGGGGSGLPRASAAAATSYGGGGGGGSIVENTSQIAGAAGFAGVVIITEYIL